MLYAIHYYSHLRVNMYSVSAIYKMQYYEKAEIYAWLY